MGTDSAQLLTAVLQEAVDEKLRNMQPAFDDMVCTTRTVNAISGSIPYLAAKDTLGKDLGAIAIGSDPLAIDMELSSVTYELKRYHHSIKVDRSVAQDLDQYINTTGEFVQQLIEHNRVAREKDLAAMLTDASLNGQHAAGNGTWDLVTSTPVLDLQQAKYNDAPNADLCILGSVSALELQRHEDITAMAGFGYASGGAVPRGVLRSIIAEILGLSGPDAVHIWETFYNSAAYGQAAALSRVTGDFCWIGNKGGLLKIAQSGRQNEATVDETHLVVENAVADTCTYKRVETFFGTEVTGL